MSPAPFGPGELLEFDIDALGAKAGTMRMQVLMRKGQTMPLEVKVETNTFFSKVLKVTATALSTLSTQTLRPVRYREDATENNVHRLADVSFHRPGKPRLTSTIDGNTITSELESGNDVADVAGAIHLLRAIPLKSGQAVCFDVYGIRRIWRVWGTVQPREHVSTPLGEFEAWHVVGRAARRDLPQLQREIHVWISDDSRRLPLAALGIIDLGAVRATLKAVARPGERSSRAEHRGNINW
jgi:hypothetical protein